MPPYLSSTCDYSLFLLKQHNTCVDRCALMLANYGE